VLFTIPIGVNSIVNALPFLTLSKPSFDKVPNSNSPSNGLPKFVKVLPVSYIIFLSTNLEVSYFYSSL
jgi:hypothetical protein